ncbi:MAG: zinc protease [Pseudobdellovibrio sp.]|nr:zinc protease [Pseudobdellovibrio sp.]
MKQTKFQLKNKLKVLLIESKKSPVVSVQMWVKTGSADEKKGEEGISHFIEHLVFKGTEKFRVGEIANTVEASGGELNAYTSFDQTVFYVTISKSFSDVALNVVSQMMGYPTFDSSEINSEREVVCEEIKMGQDSPNRRSSQLLFSSVYKKHSYGKPVIGYEKNVRGWSTKKIVDFYKSRYVPANMFLVVSGDFETADMKKKVEQYFSGFKNYPLRKVKRVKEPKQNKFQFKVQRYKIQDQHLHLAFRAPNVRHKDVPALDILAMILGQGDSSRLVKKLRLENAIANSISAFSYSPQDDGIFALSAHYQGDKFNDVVTGCLEQIKLIKNVAPDWAEIKRAIVAISSEQFYSVETVDGLANKAGSQEFYFNDQNAQKKYLAAINKVKPDDVVKVAKKYLKLEHLSVAYLGDVDESESAKQVAGIKDMWKQIVDVKPAVVKKAKAKKPVMPKLVLKAVKPGHDMEIEEIKRKSGITVVFCQSKDTPTVSAKFVFKGGARYEQPDIMGLSELAARTWISSTNKKSEEQMMHEIEESAISLSSFSGKNTSGFSLDYLSFFEKKALDLALENMLDCEFKEEIIKREKYMLEQAIKSKQDHPGSLCMRQFLKTIYGTHPLSYDATGTLETLARIKREHLVEHAAKILNPNNLVITVVGDFNKKLWLDKIEQLEKSIYHSPTKPMIHALDSFNSNKSEFLSSEKEQSHVIIGWRGLTIKSEQRFVLEAIEAILAGQGGRLFIELRDKNSLAYSVSPMKMESLETGYVGGYIACSPEKVDKAIDMFQKEFKKLIDVPVGTEELERAKRYLIGQHDIGVQRKSAICNMLAFDVIYGNDYNVSLNIAEEYKKITSDDIQKLAKELFTQPYAISIVGQKVKKQSAAKEETNLTA